MTGGAPEFDLRDRRLAILLVVTGLLVQLPGLLWGALGAKAVHNAMRILDGDVPYRDFWTMYAPGHFYLVAGLFKLFGVHVWLQGVAAQLFIAIDAALLFMIVRRLGLQRRLAFLIGMAFVLMLWGNTEVSAYETVLLFLLLALDRVVCYLSGRDSRQLFVAGVLCGVGAWFKHDVACYVTFGAVAGLAVAWILAHGRRPDNWVSPAGLLIRVGGGALLGAFPMVAYLAWKAGPDAWRDLIVFPATDFRVVRGERYPPLMPAWRNVSSWANDPLSLEQLVQLSRYLAKWVQANVPQLVFIAGAAVLLRHRRVLAPKTLAVTALALATMPLFWASAHVQQNTNFTSLWIFSILLAALVWTGGGLKPVARILLAVFFVVETGSFLIRPARDVAEIVYFWSDHAKLDFPAVSGVRLPRWEYNIYQPIVSFVREHVPESEPIYVGLGRHDMIVSNNEAFYILADRRNATRYGEIHPGIVDREAVQREMIADLERKNVRCVVLWNFGWPTQVMENLLADRRRQIPDIGSTLLDDYLRREFQEVARYGEYVLLWRKGGPIPQPPKF